MKKFKVFAVFALLLFSVTSFSAWGDLTDAEDYCYAETIKCLGNIDITSPSAHEEVVDCQIEEQLCLFFYEIDQS